MHCLDERGLTGDSETGDAETGDTKTSESERLMMKCTFSDIISCKFLLPYLVLVRLRDFNKQRTKSKLCKLMIKSLFLEIELSRH